MRNGSNNISMALYLKWLLKQLQKSLAAVKKQMPKKIKPFYLLRRANLLKSAKTVLDFSFSTVFSCEEQHLSFKYKSLTSFNSKINSKLFQYLS